MHKIGPTGATIRSAVAVRADAGDVSCPSWIARETHNRKKALSPIIDACVKVGYFAGTAVRKGLSRFEARELVAKLNSNGST